MIIMSAGSQGLSHACVASPGEAPVAPSSQLFPPLSSFLSTFIFLISAYASYPCLCFWLGKVPGRVCFPFLSKIWTLGGLAEDRNVSFFSTHALWIGEEQRSLAILGCSRKGNGLLWMPSGQRSFASRRGTSGPSAWPLPVWEAEPT